MYKHTDIWNMNFESQRRFLENAALFAYSQSAGVQQGETQLLLNLISNSILTHFCTPWTPAEWWSRKQKVWWVWFFHERFVIKSLERKKIEFPLHIAKNMWLCEIRGGFGQGVKYSGVYHSNPPCLLLCDYLIKTGLNFSWGHLGNLPGEWKYNTEKINKGAGEGWPGGGQRGEYILVTD